jgi:hypothetical protein
MAVYDPARHEPICAEPWSARRAAELLGAIATDFASAQRADASWPTHPQEEIGPDPKWCAYFGAAGAIVTLRLLARAGYLDWTADDALARVHSAYCARPDTGVLESGLQIGEIGILAPALLDGNGPVELTAQLDACMRRSLLHPAREITAGETGMMHAALHLYRETGAARWSDHFRAGAESLWKSWTRRSDGGHWLWVHEIFGSVRGYYGACHGLAGNAGALFRGADLLHGTLPDDWAETALARCAETLERGALRDGDDLNWPVSEDASGQRRLVQWCHGAAGVVTALAQAPRTGSAAARALDNLLIAAGEFVWRAGPLAKGPGLCHGTAGNGYAFLKLYLRSGEARWLERARSFAAHAILQSEQARRQYGQRRYTLWTGDGGLALYLHHCLHPDSTAIPGLDLF